MTWHVPDQPMTLRLRSYSQIDTTLTIDGKPAENFINDCGPKLCSDALWYISGVEKYPDTAKDEGWGPDFTGVTDAPQMQAYMLKRNSIPMSIYHPATAKELAHILWQVLYNNKFCGHLGYIKNPDASIVKHWYGVSEMVGGTTDKPFDTITLTSPNGGFFPPMNYDSWTYRLATYTDGALYGVSFDRTPSDLSANTQLGPL